MTGTENYKPIKGKPPINPCENCKEKPLAAIGACNNGFGICKKCMDYQRKQMIYNRSF